jgi:hypothetical protein
VLVLVLLDITNQEAIVIHVLPLVPPAVVEVLLIV